MLGVLLKEKDDELAPMQSCGHIPFLIKPWLDMNDVDTKQSFDNLMSRRDATLASNLGSSDKTVEALGQAVLAMQHLVGEECCLVHEVLASSVEHITVLISKLEMGEPYSNLCRKWGTYQKSASADQIETDEVKALTAEVDRLLDGGKILLAVQSGFLTVVVIGGICIFSPKSNQASAAA